MPKPVSETVHFLPLSTLRRFNSSADIVVSAPQIAQRMTPCANSACAWSGARSGCSIVASYWPAPVAHGGAPPSEPATYATAGFGDKGATVCWTPTEVVEVGA